MTGDYVKGLVPVEESLKAIPGVLEAIKGDLQETEGCWRATASYIIIFGAIQKVDWRLLKGNWGLYKRSWRPYNGV